LSQQAPIPHRQPRLILASASPRRQTLLREAGYEFVAQPPNVDEETLGRGLAPIELAVHLATTKAEAIAAERPDDVVLAADTVVAFGDMPLGKPADAGQARRMLELLAGTTHIVITGVAVVHRGEGFFAARRVLSAVHMKPLTAAQIDQYIAGGNWRGKAGGYGIQDPDPFVQRLAGCQTNIVGLPMTTTRQMLAAAGIGPDRANH
jgi:septum formation protein